MNDQIDDYEGFDEEQRKVIERVEKLMRLAARNTSEEEAASATVKAQELLAAYNLDASAVSADENKSAAREKMKLKGGMYEYQRELYGAVARLNFCMYWTILHKEWVSRNKVDTTGYKYTKRVLSKRFEHIIVGRLVNTRSTRVMSEYLRQVIERLVNERYSNQQRWMKEAVAFREGISDTLCNRLRAKRRDMELAEKKKREQERTNSGVSTSQALTLATLSKQEEDANADFLYGEGYSAKRAAAAAEAARKNKEAEEEYTRWAAAHPEEARKAEAEARKQRSKRRFYGGPGSRGGRTARDSRSDLSSYWQGREVGESVSIDQQVDDRPAGSPKRIGRG